MQFTVGGNTEPWDYPMCQSCCLETVSYNNEPHSIINISVSIKIRTTGIKQLKIHAWHIWNQMRRHQMYFLACCHFPPPLPHHWANSIIPWDDRIEPLNSDRIVTFMKIILNFNVPALQETVCKERETRSMCAKTRKNEFWDCLCQPQVWAFFSQTQERPECNSCQKAAAACARNTLAVRL